MTEPEPLQQIDRTYARFKSRRLSYFSGCDYYRLSSHPKVLEAAREGTRKYGLNVAASRLTTGNHWLYTELEKRLATFFRAEDALLVSSGYLTNLVVAQSLAGEFTHALIDEKAHASLSDAVEFLHAKISTFKHRDPESLKKAARRCGAKAKVLVLTDGLFSHDGSVAPLRDYLSRLPKTARLLVDDAHACGVIGASGRGSLEEAGVSRQRIIQSVTLSKAFGVFGGVILATKTLRRRILSSSKLIVASTPLPLPLAAAALESVRILSGNKKLRAKLFANSEYLKNKLRQQGLSIANHPGPIIPLIPKSTTEATDLQKALLKAGVYPPFIKYPNGPASGYFRFVVSSEHSRAQLDTLAKILAPFTG